MKIICDDKIPYVRGVFEPFADVIYLPGSGTTREIVRDADALVTRTRTICGGNLLEGSSVKVIASATIGYDHIDTRWCESHGIVWHNAPGCNSGSVAQYLASALVRLADKHSLNLTSLTLGVVGVGHVGTKVAGVGRALGMKVLLCDPPRARSEGDEAFVTLDTIISESDIITVHVPLQTEGPDATYHLFGADVFSRLNPGQFLLNSSRGPVVDNAALKAALKKHTLGGAVLDVWEGEPAIDGELLELLDFATPHIAGYSADGKAAGTTAAVRAVAQALGLPLTDFKVSDIPAPCGLEFTLDAAGRSLQEIVSEALLHTYDIKNDSVKLKTDVGSFERLRGDYPVRREPSAWTIRLKDADNDMASSLKTLGFNIIQI